MNIGKSTLQLHLNAYRRPLILRAAGDWDCTGETRKTVANMVNKNPELVLGLGDYSYRSTTDCWIEIVNPIVRTMNISIGNHDIDNLKLLSEYLSYFNLTKEYYSFSYGNAHFVAMSTELLNEDEPRYEEQLDFLQSDLSNASSDPNVDWIIVYFHRLTYASQVVSSDGSLHDRAEPALQTFHQILFDKYDVDLVLQAHNHNYERSYPLRYNNVNDPFITSFNMSNYSSPNGPIFVTVGTAGASNYNFAEKDPYIAKQYLGHGFLSIDIENGKATTTLNAQFYPNEGIEDIDYFTIEKCKKALIVKLNNKLTKTCPSLGQ